MYYLIESHLGGLYIVNSAEEVELCCAYCETCGDYDRLITSWENTKEKIINLFDYMLDENGFSNLHNITNLLGIYVDYYYENFFHYDDLVDDMIIHFEYFLEKDIINVKEFNFFKTKVLEFVGEVLRAFTYNGIMPYNKEKLTSLLIKELEFIKTKKVGCMKKANISANLNFYNKAGVGDSYIKAIEVVFPEFSNYLK